MLVMVECAPVKDTIFGMLYKYFSFILNNHNKVQQTYYLVTDLNYLYEDGEGQTEQDVTNNNPTRSKVRVEGGRRHTP